MVEFWDFFLTAESGENLSKVVFIMAAGLLLTALFTFLEYRMKKSLLFIAANAVVTVAVAVCLLIFGAGLSEFLLWLLGFLFIRLCFTLRERGNET